MVITSGNCSQVFDYPQIASSAGSQIPAPIFGKEMRNSLLGHRSRRELSNITVGQMKRAPTHPDPSFFLEAG